MLDRHEEDTVLGVGRAERVREEGWRNIRKRGQEMNGDGSEIGSGRGGRAIMRNGSNTNGRQWWWYSC